MAKQSAPSPSREQSTIAFPYVDLETAMGVANAILRSGGGQVTRDQVAGLMNTSINSGSFLNKLSATRMFGLIMMGGGKCELSDLGFAILDKDEQRQRAARHDAFLNVPLFRRVYEEFRGRQLPPRPQGLEQALVKFGVANNQRSTARTTFDRSATQAGFFPNGPDRLIAPILTKTVGGIKEELEQVRSAAGATLGEASVVGASAASQSVGSAASHPFIQGLINALPKPGAEWTMEERGKWIQAAISSFNLMYKGTGTITYIAPVENDLLKIK